MSCPPDILAKLSDMRETLTQGQQVQQWVADWWGALMPDDKRLILTLAGLDDSTENARRAWVQMLKEDRRAIVAECKRLNRLTMALKWA